MLRSQSEFIRAITGRPNWIASATAPPSALGSTTTSASGVFVMPRKPPNISSRSVISRSIRRRSFLVNLPSSPFSRMEESSSRRLRRRLISDQLVIEPPIQRPAQYGWARRSAARLTAAVASALPPTKSTTLRSAAKPLTASRASPRHLAVTSRSNSSTPPLEPNIKEETLGWRRDGA